MGAIPKRRISSGRRDRRRSHDAIPKLSLTRCPQCGEARRAHHVCPSCGTYRGRAVVDMGPQ